MLASEFGGLRPWEMREFTPAEEQQLHAYRRELDRLSQEVG